MGHSQVAKELLEAGAEVDAVREVGMTIVSLPCFFLVLLQLLLLVML